MGDVKSSTTGSPARLGGFPNPANLARMMNQAPTMTVQRLEEGGWEVSITPAGYGDPIRVTGFKSEKAAQTWMEREALNWLAAHKVAA